MQHPNIIRIGSMVPAQRSDKEDKWRKYNVITGRTQQQEASTTTKTGKVDSGAAATATMVGAGISYVWDQEES